MSFTAGRFRNVSAVPLDGFTGGRLVFPQQDAELEQVELEREQVMLHLEQRTLVPVTMAATEQRGAAPASRTSGAKPAASEQ